MELGLLLKNVYGIGETSAKKLKKLKLETVRDLLFYFPVRYEDFSKIVLIKDVKIGERVTVRCKIISIEARKTYRSKMTIVEAVLADDTGFLRAIWFNQGFLLKVLHDNDEIFVSGILEDGSNGIIFINPVYEKDTQKGLLHTGCLVPVYSLTSNLTNKQMRYFVSLVLPSALNLSEWIPNSILNKRSLLNLKDAIKMIHFPKNFKVLESAIVRFKFSEAFTACLIAQKLKHDVLLSRALPVFLKTNETQKFVKSLPFALTTDQRKSSWEILKDMSKSHAMNRLLEGAVGSGKTIVASISILNIALNNYQVAYLAPTTILAKQHFETLIKLLAKFPVRIGLLTRLDSKIGVQDIDRRTFKSKVLNGEIDVLVGTHAILQEDIKFKCLALVIVDEQHRFGVEQRQALKFKCDKGDYFPHFLSMTATPIPRSLALTIFGDLDVSMLKEMPQGRKKIITKLVHPENRVKAYDFIKNEIRKGRQAFIIYPLIEKSEKLNVRSAKLEYDRLSQEVFPDLKLGLVHGNLKPDAEQKVMADFVANKINILVATSVIEVGVDVPNASVMLIENAERFGLLQLHQFRGRIGRSKYPSYCFLFAGDMFSDEAIERLQILVDTSDGFELSEKDLRLRGPGEIYGTLQSGIPEFKMISLVSVMNEEILKSKDVAQQSMLLNNDLVIMEQAKQDAVEIVKHDPTLNQHLLLKDKILVYTQKIHRE